MTAPRLNKQAGPWPAYLESLLTRIEYKENWMFSLFDGERGQDSEGLTLQIKIFTPDSYDPERMRRTNHWFIVPAASYDERAWMRWLFNRIVDVETHEACEFFKIDGDRPYAPNHGPGRDPYSIIEKGLLADARTKPT